MQLWYTNGSAASMNNTYIGTPIISIESVFNPTEQGSHNYKLNQRHLNFVNMQPSITGTWHSKLIS